MAQTKIQSNQLPQLSFRNRIINGAMEIDQRNSGASQTITAAAALAYTIDRWYAYCTGANVTGQQVSGTSPNLYNYRFTGASSVTKIGFSQRIEQKNSQDMAGQTATLSVDLANSLLTTVTWTAWYANTADTFGTLASPTRTQIATGTFTVTSTLTRYSTNISIPSAATTGIEIEFSVGAQTSGTWTIGRIQFEIGSSATDFERRPYGLEKILCQRYFNRMFGADSAIGSGVAYTTSAVISFLSFSDMRISPTITAANPTAYNIVLGGSVVSTVLDIAFASITERNCQVNGYATSAVFTVGHGAVIRNNGTNGLNISFYAEL